MVERLDDISAILIGLTLRASVSRSFGIKSKCGRYVFRPPRLGTQEGPAMTKFAMLLLAALTTGCAAPDPIQTLSGKPDVTVTASMKCLRAGLLAEMVDQGWSIVTTSDVQIVAQKPFDSGTAKMLLTNGLGVPPMRRMTLTFIEVGSTNIRVVRDTAAVINAGNRAEEVHQQVQTNAAQLAFQTAVRKIEAQCKGTER
jgi:hypothetical protein